MCKSDEEYVPLNDGYNWKGDPNATLSGQGIPQTRPETPTGAEPESPPGPGPVADDSGVPSPAIAFAEYDPETGAYVGPDGRLYTQTNLAQNRRDQTGESMLIPPG